MHALRREAYGEILIFLRDNFQKLPLSEQVAALARARALLTRELPASFIGIAPFTLVIASILLTQPLLASSFTTEEFITAIFKLVKEACGACPSHSGSPSDASHSTASFGSDFNLFGNADSNLSDSDDGAPVPSSVQMRSLGTDSLRYRQALAAAKNGLSGLQVKHQGAVAHVLSVACDIAKESRALHLRCAALHAVHAIAFVVEPDLLAAFFPGVVSSLCRVLSKARLDNSLVAVHAIDALSVCITRTFPEKSPQREVGISSFSSIFHSISAKKSDQRSQKHSAATTLSVAFENTENSKSYSVDRNESWVRKTSQHVAAFMRTVLESNDGPRYHSNGTVREALANFLSYVGFRKSNLFLPRLVEEELFIVQVELNADEDERVHAAAQAPFSRLLRDRGLLVRFEESLQRLVDFAVSRRKRKTLDLTGESRYEGTEPFTSEVTSSDGKDALHLLLQSGDDNHWISVFKGYLNLLLSFSTEEKPYGYRTSGTKDNAVAQTLSRLDCRRFSLALLELHSDAWRPAAIDDPADYSRIDSPGSEILFNIGRAGGLPYLFGHFMDIAIGFSKENERRRPMQRDITPCRDHEDFMEKVCVCMCLQSAVRGCIPALTQKQKISDSINPEWSQVIRYGKGFLQCAALCMLPSEFDNSSSLLSWADDSSLRAKQCVLMAIAQLYGDICKIPDRRIGPDLALPIVLSLLCDSSFKNDIVRSAADHALAKVASALGYESCRELLGYHMNYIVGRLLRNLDQSWAGPVLKQMIGKENDDVSARMIEFVESSLQIQCDELAESSDVRAAATLKSVRSVLSAILSLERQSLREKKLEEFGYCRTEDAVEISKHGNRTATKVPCQTQRLLLHDYSRIKSTVMRYCTDDIEEESVQFTNEGITPGAGHRDAGGDEEKELSSFENIASSALYGVCDILIGRPAQVRALALKCAILAIETLKYNETVLLPHVANMLPMLPSQFEILKRGFSSLQGRSLVLHYAEQRGRKLTRQDELFVLVEYVNGAGNELPVICHSCELLSALVDCAGSFVQSRFVRMIFPKLEPLLRICAEFPSLLYTERSQSFSFDQMAPSFGAMAAADSALKAIASIADKLPSALKPFTKPLLSCALPYIITAKSKESYNELVQREKNVSRRTYELDRLQRREQFAERILQGLLRVNGDVVWTDLILADPQRPDIVEPPNPSFEPLVLNDVAATTC